jgi:alpha-tubulin suppressor-like RCC1 family protein
VTGSLAFTDFVTGTAWTSNLSTSPTTSHAVCGLSGGALYCWPAQSVFTTDPQPLAAGTSFTGLVGGPHNCALDPGGVPWCWGLNTDLELGGGGADCQTINSPIMSACPTPAPIALARSFTAVRVGGTNTCGRAQDGTWSCWGQADNNVLTQPEPLACRFHPVSNRYDDTCTATPVPISTSPALVSLVPGTGSICGLTAAGAAYCWGANDYGQLGNGTTAASTTPVAVSGGHTFVSLVAGGGFYCGLDGAGEVWCWGANSFGQLGNGGTANSSVPVAVF